MTTLKQINEIKNLLLNVKYASLEMDEFYLTSKIDAALIAFVNEFENRTKNMKGADILEAIK